MKFITEDDLRNLYKENPFASYELEPGSKLTPGARDFLSDRFKKDFYTTMGGTECQKKK